MTDPQKILQDMRAKVLAGYKMTEEDDRLIAEALMARSEAVVETINKKRMAKTPLSDDELKSLF